MVKLKTLAMARGLDEMVSSRLLSSEPKEMLTFLRHMEERYGGFQNYLADANTGADIIYLIERRILAEQPMSQPAPNNF